MKKIWLQLQFIMLLFLVGIGSLVHAADVVDVSPITDQILCLTFSEGHIDYYGMGETVYNGKDNRIYYSPWPTAAATAVNNYSITSDDDAKWGVVVPTSIGRKTKGQDYNYPAGAAVTPPEFILQHQIYLQLPKAMQSGKTYSISLASLADNVKKVTFCFDEKSIRSESIHVNQVGFAQTAQKHAYLSQWMGDKNGLDLNRFQGKPFRILRFDDKSIAYSGNIQFRVYSTNVEASWDFGDNTTTAILNPTYADVADCDFSTFTEAGTFVVSVPGMGCSFPFEIKNDITRDAFYVAMKGIYYQRCGIVKETSDGRIIPRCHHSDAPQYLYYSPETVGNNVSLPNPFPTTRPIQGVWGWYHDAADWDSQAAHCRVPALLMMVYELYPDRFFDGEVGNRYKLNESDPQWIDEGTNGIPDILDEAAWYINYYRRAKYAIMNQYGGTGGVPGYVGRDSTDGTNQTSWVDQRPGVLTGQWPKSTMSYSALASEYAYCLKLAGITSVTVDGVKLTPDDYKQEAIDAYNWAINHDYYNCEVPDSMNELYGLKSLAELNLYKITGNTSYQDAAVATFSVYQNGLKDANGNLVLGSNNKPICTGNDYSYESTEIPYGFLTAAEVVNFSSAINMDFKTNCSNYVKTKADYLSTKEANSGYRYSEPLSYFQIGVLANPRIFNSAVAYKAFGTQQYLDTAQNTVSYVLGGNQSNTTLITGLGWRKQRGVCHLDSFVLNDYNSKVYNWEPVEGLGTYFGDNDNFYISGGAGNNNWAAGSLYPLKRSTPRAEASNGCRESIAGSEFTIVQCNGPWIFATAFLKAVYAPPTSVRAFNQRPTVSLNLSDEQNVDPYKPLTLSANTSSDTSVVKYYYEWHYIGQSTDKANQFSFNWDLSQCNLVAGDHALITAVAYDNKGLISMPSENGDKTITLSEIPSAKVNAINYNSTTGLVEISGYVPGKNAVNVILKVSDEKSKTIVYLKQIKLDSSNTFDFQFTLPTQGQMDAYSIKLGGDVLTPVGTVYAIPKNDVGLWIKASGNSVTARVTDTGSSSVDSRIIVVVYDANRKVQEIHTMPVKASAGSDATQTVTLNESKNANNTVEVYLWDGVNQMHPITRKVNE